MTTLLSSTPLVPGKARRIAVCAWLWMPGLLTTHPMMASAPRIIGNIAITALKASPEAWLPVLVDP